MRAAGAKPQVARAAAMDYTLANYPLKGCVVKRVWNREAAAAWSRELLLLAAAIFVLRFGEGLVGGARANFFVDTLSLDGGQVLWLEGVREVPGLLLMVIAAFLTQVPLARRGGLAVALMGIGFITHALVQSYSALLVVSVVASLGNHIWMPISPALGLSLATKETSGRVLGSLGSVGALASIVGMGALAVISRFAAGFPLRIYFVVGGVLMLAAAGVILLLPASVGATERKQPRMLLKGRYWLFYVLTLFDGARKQVLYSFGTLVLVQYFGYEVWQISLILLASATVNLVFSPALGAAVDRYGERATLSLSYVGIALCCAAFAVLRDPLLLAVLVVLIKLLQVLGMGLNTYVNRMAPDEELTPTLTAGISINHVSSVVAPLVAGAVMPIIGYQGVFLATAVLIALSVPFAAALRVEPLPAPAVELRPSAAAD